VHDFVAQAAEFAARSVQGLMVDPGPAGQLTVTAQEFLTDTQSPAGDLLVIDPDDALTDASGLNWDARNETADPSMFMIGGQNRVQFAQVSRSHGDRVGAADAIKSLAAIK
jgi:hypothetical protein